MPETPTPEQILDSAIRDVEMAIHLMGHSGTDPMAWMDTARQSLVRLQALLDSHGRETQIEREAFAAGMMESCDHPLKAEWVDKAFKQYRNRTGSGNGHELPPVLTLDQIFAPDSPFEYDQGDIVLTHYDDLYNLKQRADPAHGRERDERLAALLKEEIDGENLDNAQYCWWCQADFNGKNGPKQEHAANCWWMRVRAALADRPQGHSKDCAVWLGTSANPESPPLECDCGLAQQGRGQDSTPTLTIQGLDGIGHVLDALRAAGYQITNPPANAILPSSQHEEIKNDE